MRPSREELLRIVRTFYPSGVQQGDPAYLTSSEILRLEHVREEASAYAGRARWASVLRRIGTELPGHVVEDWTYTVPLNCWRCRVYLPGATLREANQTKDAVSVVGLVSIFAPVHVVYSSMQRREGDRFLPSRTLYQPLPETEHAQGVLERTLRSELHTDAVEADALFTPIPDISCFNIPHGRAMLIDALFTDDRW